VICIWCQQQFEILSVEHGIPEALGCPEDLVLTDVACEACNNAFGSIDQALLKQFEPITVMYGVPRKKGRRPTIDSWRAISSKHKPDGPHIFLNAGPGVIEAEGKGLHPAAKSNGIHDVWMKPETGQLGFKQEFGNDRRFIPALYKIGLNLVARHYGAHVVAGPAYDHVRAFVRDEPGAPEMRAAMDDAVAAGPVSGASNPIVKAGRDYPLFSVTLLGVTFLIDMSPDQAGLRDLKATAILHGEPFYLFPARKAA
jgi:hypothetical protein